MFGGCLTDFASGAGRVPCLQAAQYRLELQQLKSEHAALQMLTQHADQETVRHAGVLLM